MAGCPNGRLSQWPAVPMAGCPNGWLYQWLAVNCLTAAKIGRPQRLDNLKDWKAPKIGQPQRLDSPKD